MLSLKVVATATIIAINENIQFNNKNYLLVILLHIADFMNKIT